MTYGDDAIRHGHPVIAPNPEPAYVCPQCGPDTAGADKHAATHHTWPPADEDATTPEFARGGPVKFAPLMPSGCVVPAAASATTADDSGEMRAIAENARALALRSRQRGSRVQLNPLDVIALADAVLTLAARDAELRRAHEVIGSVASDLSELLPDDNDRILGDTVLSTILRSVDELNAVAS